MYDKQRGTCKLLPIKEVAQAAGFYDNVVEKSLNDDVEIPGSGVIDKIRRGESIDAVDRARLAYYVGTMMRRVPLARTKAYEMIPQILAETVTEIRSLFEKAAEAGHIDANMLKARLAEADAAEEKLRNQPPSNVVQIIETPWPLSGMLSALFQMEWRFVRTAGPSYFLTSDNPAYHFEAHGLGTEKSELILPMSSDMLLHCSWQLNCQDGIPIVPQKLVKEFNRRTASGAARFVFYHQEAPWILSAAKNSIEQLNRIQW
jgi:hypothetical protein